MALSYNYKGTGPITAKYASGGECITTKSRFLKTPDVFRTSIEKQDYPKKGKTGTLSKPEGESKSKKAITPKS